MAIFQRNLGYPVAHLIIRGVEVFLGGMPFLSLKQQRLTTEGLMTQVLHATGCLACHPPNQQYQCTEGGKHSYV